ncbi:MAG: regulatory protein GemA [Paracoccus denitrificans]|nr:MAG: regulatory protein GemA [Paracoccus denitrificans]PZO83649.1 MAG: regulatory protein GemA [Paracoccus denitrificans]
MNHIAIINIAKAELGLSEDDYRALLVRVTGKASLRTMSERQKISVIEEFKRCGFKIKVKGRALPQAHKPYIRLIHALWKSCHQAGAVENGSREALRAFCKRFVAHDDGSVAVDPDFLSHAQATPIITALKGMEARAKEAKRG